MILWKFWREQRMWSQTSTSISLGKKTIDSLNRLSNFLDTPRTDLNGLTGENWVNDNIIEVYMQMVAERSCTKTWRNLGRPRVYCMSTYFFISLIKRGHGAMQRWTKDVDIFSYDIILIPIHQEDHWCLATVDFRSPGNWMSEMSLF